MGVPFIQLFLFLPLELSDFCHFNDNMSWCGSVWVHLVWDPLCLLNLEICFLLQVWEFFSHDFVKYIFDPLFSLLLGPPLI